MSGILDEYQNLAAYLARAEARSAYIQAFAAQFAMNAHQPAETLAYKVEPTAGLQSAGRAADQYSGASSLTAFGVNFVIGDFRELISTDNFRGGSQSVQDFITRTGEVVSLNR